MSSRKFTPYENKKGNYARRSNSESKFEFPAGSSEPKRDVFPQFSEPEDYNFSRGAQCSTFQTMNRSYQSIPNYSTNKTWAQPHSSGHTEQFGNTLPLYQPLPTFRQYMNEENDDDIPRPSVQGSMAISHHQNEPFVQKGFEKFQLENENNSDKNQQEKNQKALIGTRHRHMLGTVDHVTRWHKMAKHSGLEILYEVVGKLESTINKGFTQLLFIRSDSGHILQGVFYSIDRELPIFPPGTIVTATGSMIGSNKMQIFDANKITRDDLNAVQRLAFLSQRALEAAL